MGRPCLPIMRAAFGESIVLCGHGSRKLARSLQPPEGAQRLAGEPDQLTRNAGAPMRPRASASTVSPAIAVWPALTIGWTPSGR